MLNIVSNVLWYAVGISVLFLAIVFIHEFGHFIVAKLFGIKVEVFSIGFGPKILKKKWGETEYCLSILPLGGYVKIHGQEPGEKINPSDTHAFANKPVWQRSCVVAAGPIFNFLLTVTLLFLVAGVIGRESVVSSIGYVESGSYAESQGFQEGDKIVSIEKSPVQFWREDVEELFTTYAGQEISVQVERDSQTLELKLISKRESLQNPLGEAITVGHVPGMAPWSYQPVIGFDLKNSILSKLGFMIGDKILSINGHKVETFSQISGQLKVLSGAILKAEIQRGLKTLEVSGQLPRAENLSVNPAFVIQSVGKNKPAAVAGLKEGDVLVSLNGKSVYEAKPTLEDVVKGIEESLKVMGQVQVGFVRSGEFKEVSVSGVQAPLPNGQMKYIIGIATGYLQNEPMVAKWRAGGIFASLSYSLETTIEWTLSILKTLKMLIFGQLSPKVLGGPIAIGAMAGERFKQGASYFLDIMAFISINLGVINFIPLPIFDGGHFLFFTIEAIRRKPIGEMGTRIANIVGIVLIVSLLVFVFYVDIARILGV